MKGFDWKSFRRGVADALLIIFIIALFRASYSYVVLEEKYDAAIETHKTDSIYMDSLHIENTMLKMLTTPETIEMLRQSQ